MSQEKVEYKKSDIISILRTLNMLVVSLDRIGSEYSIHVGRKSDEELNALLADFIFGWKVPQKIAEARRLLDKAFSRELGVDDLDELEREFRDLRYWSLDNSLLEHETT